MGELQRLTAFDVELISFLMAFCAKEAFVRIDFFKMSKEKEKKND